MQDHPPEAPRLFSLFQRLYVRPRILDKEVKASKAAVAAPKVGVEEGGLSGLVSFRTDS